MVTPKKAKKKAATKGKAAKVAPKRAGAGRPARVSGGTAKAGQIAVGLSELERSELKAYATDHGETETEVVRIALRKLGAISEPA